MEENTTVMTEDVEVINLEPAEETSLSVCEATGNDGLDPISMAVGAGIGVVGYFAVKGVKWLTKKVPAKIEEIKEVRAEKKAAKKAGKVLDADFTEVEETSTEPDATEEDSKKKNPKK